MDRYLQSLSTKMSHSIIGLCDKQLGVPFCSIASKKHLACWVKNSADDILK